MSIWNFFKKPNSVYGAVESFATQPINAQVDYSPVVVLKAEGTLKPTYKITKYCDHDRSKAMNRASNAPPIFQFGHLFPTKKTQRIHIFNLSTQTFNLSRPPYFGDITIPGVKDGEEYALAFSMPHPMPLPRTNFDDNTVEMIWEDARRLATDIVNPNNLGVNPKDPKYSDLPYSLSIGTDLTAMGVFWSFHAVPTKTEIKVYRKRMEARYRDLLSQIWMLYISGRSIKGEISPAHHAAAEYFKQNLPWHVIKSTAKTQETK